MRRRTRFNLSLLEACCIVALALTPGCALRLQPGAGQIERLEVKCSAPSRIAWSLDGELRFERVSPQPLPSNVRCVPPVVEVGPP